MTKKEKAILKKIESLGVDFRTLPLDFNMRTNTSMTDAAVYYLNCLQRLIFSREGIRSYRKHMTDQLIDKIKTKGLLNKPTCVKKPDESFSDCKPVYVETSDANGKIGVRYPATEITPMARGTNILSRLPKEKKGAAKGTPAGGPTRAQVKDFEKAMDAEILRDIETKGIKEIAKAEIAKAEIKGFKLKPREYVKLLNELLLVELRKYGKV